MVMARNSERLYRVGMAVLKDPAEAQDVVQDTFVQAYLHLDQYAGKAKFSTWLTRIAIREAWARLRRSRGSRRTFEAEPQSEEDPEHNAHVARLAALAEAELSALPPGLRIVYVLGELEGMRRANIADVLGITAANVRIRLHRARALLAQRLLRRVGAKSSDALRFAGEDCARLGMAVFRRLGLTASGSRRDPRARS